MALLTFRKNISLVTYFFYIIKNLLFISTTNMKLHVGASHFMAVTLPVEDFPTTLN